MYQDLLNDEQDNKGNDKQESITHSDNSVVQESITCPCYLVAAKTYFPILFKYFKRDDPLVVWAKAVAGEDSPKEKTFESADDLVENLMHIVHCFAYKDDFYLLYPEQNRTEAVVKLRNYIRFIYNNMSTTYTRQDISVKHLLSASLRKELISSESSSSNDGNSDQDEEWDYSELLPSSFYEQYEQFSVDSFNQDPNPEGLQDLYRALGHSRKSNELFQFKITNSRRKEYNFRNKLFAEYLQNCIEKGMSLNSNLLFLNDFINSWKRRDVTLSSELHMEVFQYDWISKMFSDCGRSVKQNCKMSLNEDSSKYCRPDMFVEDDAVCMECKLVNVLNCENDIRKATLLPLRMMQERDLLRGLGLLADSKYVYSFFMELDNDSNYYKWIYCHRFEMDQLYDRCLLFFILLRFLIQRSGNKVLEAEYNRLKALATTWENEKKGNDSSATIYSTQSKGRPTGSVSSSNHSSTQRSIHSNTISTTQAQQKKKLLFKKHIKDRTERILNDVSNFHNIHSH